MGRALGRERGALGHLDNREEISSVTVRARQTGGDSCLRQVAECSRRLDIYLAIICGRVGQSLAVRAQGLLASEGRVSQPMEFFLCVCSGCQILTGHRQEWPKDHCQDPERGVVGRTYASLIISPRNKTKVLEMAECWGPCSSLAQF